MKHPIVHALTRVAAGVALATSVSAQETSDAVSLEEIVVTGIRSSIERAQDIKRSQTGVVDAIAAEDLGKFPDLNVAESLQRIPGVAIDRSGGEGQQVTVRGLGPQFNTVLLNGRRVATESGGREFNFDLLAAEQISGATVYKTGQSRLQSGGIGATIDVSTQRPLDTPGLQIAGSIKAVYETLSEESTPAASILLSNTFADDTFGASLAVSHQEREVQINRIETNGWRSGQTISNRRDGVLFTNAFIPRNWDQIIDQQERTRTNASIVLQYAPSDDLTVTLDGYKSKFEVDSRVRDLASWFEPDRVGSASIDPATGTLLSFTQEQGLGVSSGDPATDFVSHRQNGRDAEVDGFGLNVEWQINDRLKASFDASTSSAEDDQAARQRFNVIGIINNYSFAANPGGTPVVDHDGFGAGALPAADRTRLHYQERAGNNNQDEIDEAKFDFTYQPESSLIESINFGAYTQARENSRFRVFGNTCGFCGYQVPSPNGQIGLEPFTAENFFPGLINTFYTYDDAALEAFLNTTENTINPARTNTGYTINEDITGFYADATLNFSVGDMPLTVSAGARYAETEVAVDATQSELVDLVANADITAFTNVFGAPSSITGRGEYDNLLPSVIAKLEPNDSMVLRFAAYESLTRPTMTQMSPVTTFNVPRRQELTGQGGNSALEPFESTNFDLSYEWYYSDASALSLAYFRKDIGNFITTLVGEESFTLGNRSAANGFRCAGALCGPGIQLDPNRPGFDVVANTDELIGESEAFRVARPQNSESAEIDGFEVAVTHVFDNGFGISANATFVDSDINLGADTSRTFALEGLGDSQNLTFFYEDDRFQARVAYNNREAFLRSLSNGNTNEPVNTQDYYQVDVSASYELNEYLTLFFEGINITEEELVQTGRFVNQTYNIEDNGARYAVGVRGKF